jgi:DNA-binding transcriptional LysR family regulator
LIEHAGTIARACEAAEAAMRRFRDGWLGRVHIGTTLTALTYVLPPVLRGLRTQYPNIDLVLTNMATRDTVEKLLGSEIDFGLVTLPIKPGPFIVTPLRAETCVAILPAGTPNVPDIITPSYVAQQSLVLEHDKGAVHALVMQWLAEHLPLTRRPMYVGIVEAAKQAVASGLGMSIVPDVAVTTALPEIIVRPMKPVLPCTLALVERRNKPAQTVLNVVRSALLELQTPEAAAIDPERRARRATRAQESSAGAEDVDA